MDSILLCVPYVQSRILTRRKWHHFYFHGGSLEREIFENMQVLLHRGPVARDKHADGAVTLGNLTMHFNALHTNWDNVLLSPSVAVVASEFTAGAMVSSPMISMIFNSLQRFLDLRGSPWIVDDAAPSLNSTPTSKLRAHLTYFLAPKVHGNDLRAVNESTQKRQLFMTPLRSSAVHACQREVFSQTESPFHLMDAYVMTEARLDASWDGTHYHYHHSKESKFYGDVSMMITQVWLNMICSG